MRGEGAEEGKQGAVAPVQGAAGMQATADPMSKEVEEAVVAVVAGAAGKDGAGVAEVVEGAVGPRGEAPPATFHFLLSSDSGFKPVSPRLT